MVDSKSKEVKRKYQVFISSTFKDLEEHRREAITGIMMAGHIPIALENFPPEPDPTENVIYKAIEDCQFYVLILGHRYGSTPKGQGRGKKKSYTEIELDHAEQKKLKVLAFLMDEKLVDKLRRKLKRSNVGDREELDNTKKYYALRARLTDNIKTPYHKPFREPRRIREELRVYFAVDHNVPGLIPELEPGSDINTILKVSLRNPIVRAVVKRFDRFEDRSVGKRFDIEREKKETLAKAFFHLHGDDIQNKYNKIFFESGSTIAYLARELSGKLPTSIAGTLGKPGCPLIITNNAFAYLNLWLCSGILCHPEPEGSADDKYGGMYGPLANRDIAPNYSLPPLEEDDPEGLKIIKKLSKKIFDYEHGEKEQSIILAAASGLQVSNDIDARYFDERTGNTHPTNPDDKILKLMEKCRGFHVGSYRNKLFKRCYYLTGIPTVVFIHDKKVDCTIDIGRCHFLFDKGEPWEDFSESYPLSIWIGCEKNTCNTILTKMESHMKRGKWKFVIYKEHSDYPIVIGHNELFRKTCEKIAVRPKMT